MKQERRAIRVGVALILLAAVWRLAGGGGGDRLLSFFQKPDVAAFLVYLETGRVVRLSAQAQTEPQTVTTLPQPSQPEETTPSLPAQTEPAPSLRFAPEDSGLLSVYKACSYSVDKETLLMQSLDWDLTGPEPTVLILHTHTTESYTKGALDYVETATYRTLDTQYNMVQVGARLTQRLQQLGIGVIHDTSVHDYPSYTGSYNHSRKTTKEYLEQYPSLKLVLDIHRDAAENSDGSQMATAATVDGQDSAQLMLLVGSDAAGLSHPNWRENMALAAKLQVTLEKQWPGITRPLCFRAERFNQDLLPGALLVEVGTAGNTLEEALVAADSLAWAISQLAKGANTG